MLNLCADAQSFILKCLKDVYKRQYKAEMPPKEMIDEIVKAGLYAASGMGPVSYTHLDVYKRQVQCFVILS